MLRIAVLDEAKTFRLASSISHTVDLYDSANGLAERALQQSSTRTRCTASYIENFLQTLIAEFCRDAAHEERKAFATVRCSSAHGSISRWHILCSPVGANASSRRSAPAIITCLTDFS